MTYPYRQSKTRLGVWLLSTTSLSGTWPLLSAFVLAMGIASSQTAQALPEGGTYAGGGEVIDADGDLSVFTIDQTSDRVIINWKSFNIGSDEHVYFNQPNTRSIALNRDYSGSISEILGTLTANGHVWIINSNGILFGAGSVINVNGLVATSHGISDADFIRVFDLDGVDGKYDFNIPGEADAMVINEGTITVGGTAEENGIAVLVAPRVRNSGIITARLGKVGLGAGKGFTLDMYGDELIVFTGDALSSTYENAVYNDGEIHADGGYVLLTAKMAGDFVGNAINMDGVIRANTLVEGEGKIVLNGGVEGIVLVKGGTLEASGDEDEDGGTIEVLGEDVNIVSSDIDASGDDNGGTIRIEAEEDVNIVGSDIDASGNKEDGGTISIEAEKNDVNIASSYIDASGGDNGGTIRIEAKKDDVDVNIAGSEIDASGDNGDGGTIKVLGGANVTIKGFKPNIGYDRSKIDASGGENGGTIRIEAVEDVKIVASDIDASGKNEDGGTIDISGQNVSFNTDLDSRSGRSVQIEASGGENGGTIIIRAEEKVSSSESEMNLTLNAEATAQGKGKGGDIFILANTVDLLGTSQKDIIAKGYSGRGGTVLIFGKTKVNIEHTEIDTEPSHKDGSGGAISILGEEVIITNSWVTASGAPGGTVQIGGEYLIDEVKEALEPRGIELAPSTKNNPTPDWILLPTSKVDTTTSKISANGSPLDTGKYAPGSGGKIIIWAGAEGDAHLGSLSVGGAYGEGSSGGEIIIFAKKVVGSNYFEANGGWDEVLDENGNLERRIYTGSAGNISIESESISINSLDFRGDPSGKIVIKIGGVTYEIRDQAGMDKLIELLDDGSDTPPLSGSPEVYPLVYSPPPEEDEGDPFKEDPDYIPPPPPSENAHPKTQSDGLDPLFHPESCRRSQSSGQGLPRPAEQARQLPSGGVFQHDEAALSCAADE